MSYTFEIGVRLQVTLWSLGVLGILGWLVKEWWIVDAVRRRG